MIKTTLLLALIFFLPSVSSASDLEWTALLKQWVEINTGTQNLDGLRKFKSAIKNEFISLGFEEKEIEIKNGRSVLIFEVPDAKPIIGLYGHLDTVFQADSPFQHFEKTDTELHGPGVIDMKGGIVLIREIIRSLKKDHPEKLLQLRILFNDDEEIGSPDSKLVLNEHSQGLKYGFVFEPGAEGGAFVASQSGIQWVELIVHGKASHAGLEYEKGRNACLELSRFIPPLVAETRLAKHFTVNVGTLNGGTSANVVCEEAKAKFDIRYVDPKDLAHWSTTLHSKIKALPSDFTATVNTPVNIPSMGPEKTKVLAQQFKTIAQSLRQPFQALHFGYVADSNHLQEVPGLELLVGIGPYGSAMHSDRETMKIESFEKRKNLFLAWITEVLPKSASFAITAGY